MNKPLERNSASADGRSSSGFFLHWRNPLRERPSSEYFQCVRDDVLQAVREFELRAESVLELGCSSGVTGRRLKELLGARRYVGVEKDPDAARAARQVLDEVHCVDLDATAPERLRLADETFDLLLALDVLEHLYDPWETLARYARLVRPGGHVLLTFPNVGHLSVVEGLLSGRWSYQASGLLDASHVRFFTPAEAEGLVEGAGLRLVRVVPKLVPQLDAERLRETGNQVRVGAFVVAGLTRQQVLSLFTYQFLVVARREPLGPVDDGAGR